MWPAPWLSRLERQSDDCSSTQVRVRIPDQEKFFSVFSESADDSNNFQIVQICARATSSGQKSQWMTCKWLVLYRWGLETEDTRYNMGKSLKNAWGVMRGLLSVSGSTRNTREIRHT